MSDAHSRATVAKAFVLEMHSRGVEKITDPAVEYHLALLLRPEGHPAIKPPADSVSAPHDPPDQVVHRDVKPDNVALTFAAEAAGVLESRFAAPLLLPLLGHESALVREGAVLGLSPHLRAPGVRAALERLAKEDPSPGVRSTAAGAYDDDDVSEPREETYVHDDGTVQTADEFAAERGLVAHATSDAACTCGPALAIGADLQLGCPVHDDAAIENRRREKLVDAQRTNEAVAMASTDLKLPPGPMSIDDFEDAVNAHELGVDVAGILADAKERETTNDAPSGTTQSFLEHAVKNTTQYSDGWRRICQELLDARKENNMLLGALNVKERERREHRDALQAWADKYAVAKPTGKYLKKREADLWEACCELGLRVPLISAPGPKTDDDAMDKAACICGPALAAGADLEIGCPVHDDLARENRRRERLVAQRTIEAPVVDLPRLRWVLHLPAPSEYRDAPRADYPRTDYPRVTPQRDAMLTCAVSALKAIALQNVPSITGCAEDALGAIALLERIEREQDTANPKADRDG